MGVVWRDVLHNSDPAVILMVVLCSHFTSAVRGDVSSGNNKSAMKIPRGTVNIGKIKEQDVYLNWSELLAANGGLGASAQRELALGNLLRWVAILIIVAAIAVAALSGSWKNIGIILPRTPAELLFWTGALLLCLSAFL